MRLAFPDGWCGECIPSKGISASIQHWRPGNRETSFIFIYYDGVLATVPTNVPNITPVLATTPVPTSLIVAHWRLDVIFQVVKRRVLLLLGVVQELFVANFQTRYFYPVNFTIEDGTGLGAIVPDDGAHFQPRESVAILLLQPSR